LDQRNTLRRQESDLENLLLLMLLELAETRDVLVGQLLNVLQPTLLLVLRNSLLLEGPLQLLVCVSPDIANCRSVFLGQLGDNFGKLATALFGERRYRDSDKLPVIGRVDIQIGASQDLLYR